MLHKVFVIIFVSILYHGVRSGTTHPEESTTLLEYTTEQLEALHGSCATL